jgi:peptide deformylase
MIRPILRLGDTALQFPATRVDAVTPQIESLVEDMLETMYAAPGIGLAAPQIGVSLRIFVIDLSMGRDQAGIITMINPEWVTRDGMQLEEEGCLSLPGFTATVPRPAHAIVRGWNRAGELHTVEGSDLLARALQHEMDHLDGKLFVDRLRGIKRDLIVRKVKKLARAGKW